MFLTTILFILAHVTVVTLERQGIAVIEQLNEGDSRFEIRFVLSNANGRVQVYSSFSLPDQLTATWQIHHLPVKMGSETCSETELGGCFECNEIMNPNSNNPTETRPVCIKSSKGSKLSLSRSDLPDCVTIKGKDGLVGRSVVVRVEPKLNSGGNDPKIYCATIYDQNNLNPQFMSTIAWFDSPLTGFVAFRKESPAVSYIIVNLTRTVDNRVKMDEDLKWEIRGKNINSRDSLYNPSDVRTEDAKYNENCDPSSDTGHKSCAVGDLWKKHGRLKLKSSMQVLNLMMFVDNNLASENLSVGQNLVILNTTSKSNGTVEQIVAWSKIEDLEPISANIPFLDGSTLKLLQRDDWSPIGQSYETAHQNTPGKWEVSVYNLPPIQLFGGDQWDCEQILTRGWSHSHHMVVPPFKTSREERFLNQNYTLYGRNSLMYRGVAIKPENDAKYKCATITYKQGEEKISYSLLKPIDQDMKVQSQRVIVIIIEHTMVRQTTVMMATLCQSSQFLLKLTENPECKDNARDTYNPFGVCPAYCPLEGPCKAECPPKDKGPDGDLYTNCCTMCLRDSSFLCPVGDLHRRLDVFQTCRRNYYTNRETVFSVKNEINLPLSQMNNKFIGMHVFYNDPTHGVLMRCGVVKELTETVVTLDKADGIKEGTVQLTQRTAWQPITVTYEGIEVDSLTIWDKPMTLRKTCESSFNSNKRPFYQEDFRKNEDVDSTSGDTTSYVKRSITLENKEKIPTFFGKESIIEKSLTLVYKTRDGRSETTRVTIRPDWAQNETEKLEAVLVDGENDQRVLKFNFEQRKGHLAADTYVKVEVLSKKYCGKRIKWYLVSNKSVGNFRPGDSFEVQSYDAETLQGAHNEQQKGSCIRTPQMYPYNLDMGDLSGILGDVELDGPGRVYVHESLPLLEGNSTKKICPTRKNSLYEVEGHYLLIADVNNTILDTIELKTPEERPNPPVEPQVPDDTNMTIIILVVAGGAIIIMAGSLVLCKMFICQQKSRMDPAYINLPTDPHRPPHGPELKMCINKNDNTYCYLHKDEVKLYKVKTQDAKTGEVRYVHLDDLALVSTNEADPQFMRYVESNGSTNGSSLTRSRGTVAEENLYTTVSPTAGHPNNMESLIASPESSVSSLSSHTYN